MQAASVVSDTNGFISFWLRSLETRGETHNSWKSMLTLLCWPHPNARRISLCLISQFISASQDPKNNLRASTATFNGWITKYRLLRSKTQQTSFWNPQFSEPSLLGMTSSKLQPHFLSGCLLWQMVIVISFPREHKTAAKDYAPGLSDPNSSRPFQTWW